MSYRYCIIGLVGAVIYRLACNIVDTVETRTRLGDVCVGPKTVKLPVDRCRWKTASVARRSRPPATITDSVDRSHWLAAETVFTPSKERWCRGSLFSLNVGVRTIKIQNGQPFRDLPPHAARRIASISGAMLW